MLVHNACSANIPFNDFTVNKFIKKIKIVSVNISIFAGTLAFLLSHGHCAQEAHLQCQYPNSASHFASEYSTLLYRVVTYRYSSHMQITCMPLAFQDGP